MVWYFVNRESSLLRADLTLEYIGVLQSQEWFVVRVTYLGGKTLNRTSLNRELNVCKFRNNDFSRRPGKTIVLESRIL